MKQTTFRSIYSLWRQGRLRSRRHQPYVSAPYIVRVSATTIELTQGLSRGIIRQRRNSKGINHDITLPTTPMSLSNNLRRMDLRHIFAVLHPQHRVSDSRTASRRARRQLIFPFSSMETASFPSGVTAADGRQAYIATSAGDMGSRVRMRSRLRQANQEI